MGLSRRRSFFMACGFAAASVACGDSTLNSADGGGGGNGEANTGATNGGGANGGNTSGTTGGDSNGTTGGTACMPAPCTCDDGQMGFAQCEGDTLGACTCSIDLSDAGLPPPSPCPDKFSCNPSAMVKGIDGYCAASPATPDAGPGGADGGGTTGGTTGGFPGGGGLPAFPPMCAMDTDCDTAGLTGVKCTTITFANFPIQLCIQPCEP